MSAVAVVAEDAAAVIAAEMTVAAQVVDEVAVGGAGAVAVATHEAAGAVAGGVAEAATRTAPIIRMDTRIPTGTAALAVS
jgi:hypothetical protein